MQNAYATNIEPVKDCIEVHFFEIIDKLWKGKKCAPNPLHRFFTLMRKMRARSFVREKLVPNSELLEEQSMAAKRCNGQVVIISVIRLTFFFVST